MTGRGIERVFRRVAMMKPSLLWASLLAAAWGPPFLPAAPAPFYPKDAYVGAVNESYLVGTWEVVCGEYRSVVTFHRDGRYFCRRDGREYVGKWKLYSGRYLGLLIIEESASGKETPIKFRVRCQVASGMQGFVGSLSPAGEQVSMGLAGLKDAVFRRQRESSRNGRR
jgi:hypothetical protein